MLNNAICRCECKHLKKHHVYKKYYICNTTTCSCENGKYSASTIDDSVIMCNRNKTISTNFNDKKITCHTIFLFFTLC